MNRYKPVGWRYESYRHYLAAKGIKTRYDNRFFVKKDEKGRILCEECGLPLNVKRPLVDKKCQCDRPWFAKKPVLSDYFVRKPKKTSDTEYDKWVAVHNVKVKSIKPSARTKYARHAEIDWVALQKKLAKRKKGESPYDVAFEGIESQLKPIQSRMHMTAAEKKIVRKQIKTMREKAAIKEQLDSIIRTVSEVPGGGMRRKPSAEEGSKKRKKKDIDEDEEQLPKKKPKAGKLGEAIELEGSYAEYGELLSGKEERMPKPERVARIKKNPRGTPAVRAEEFPELEGEDDEVDSY